MLGKIWEIKEPGHHHGQPLGAEEKQANPARKGGGLVLRGNVEVKDKRLGRGWADGETGLVRSARARAKMPGKSLKGGYSMASEIIKVTQDGSKRDLAKLLMDGADINYQDIRGLSALHWAVIGGQKSKAKQLLDHGVDPNLNDWKGMTPLHWAVRQELEDIVELLLEYGSVDVNCKSEFGNTPIGYAIEIKSYYLFKMLVKCGARLDVYFRGCSLLGMACAVGSVEIYNELLALGADVNSKDEWERGGGSALDWAVQEGYEEIVMSLLQRGVDVNAVDNQNRSSLFTAVGEERINLVRLLIEFGVNLDIEEELGGTALHLACAWGYSDIVRLLVDSGAGVNILDDEGETPVFHAARQGHFDVVELLCERGVDLGVKNVRHGSVVDVAREEEELEIADYLQKQIHC